MNVIKIDSTWEIEIGNNVTLIEITKNKSPKARNEFTRLTRGYYAHIDEALNAYMRKAINPNSEVSEIIDIIESNIKNLKAKGIIK